VMAGVGVVFSAIALFAATSLITYLLTAFRALTLSMCFLAPFVLIQIVERRRPMALITVVAFSIVLATTVHDIVRSQGVINGGVFLAPYGLLTFLLLQSYIVARRSAYNAHLVRHHAQILEAEVERQTKDLKTAMVAAEAANAAKTQFLNAVSHEIRTPLTSIIGFTQILEEELQSNATRQDLEFVHLIRDSGDRLLRLVNDLLDLAKIETGKLDLDVRDVSLESAVSDVLRQSFPIARSKSLTLTASPSIGNYTVRADPMRLHQILLNLVTNALKFTEEGGVSITAEDATLFGPDETGRPAVAILVADTGSGMSQEFLPHVFDRFTQELRSSRNAQRGTGLGLALTRELTLRMNGRIEVESELGRGSVFTVTLPLATSPSDRQTRPHGDGGTGAAPAPREEMSPAERFITP
ncbi:MAG TPA: HAMP domain-containing sensor histidine kinase, partial [Rhodothermales bacterium]